MFHCLPQSWSGLPSSLQVIAAIHCHFVSQLVDLFNNLLIVAASHSVLLL